MGKKWARVYQGGKWVWRKSPVGLSPRKRLFSPVDFIPGVGPVRKGQKAWKYRKYPRKAAKWAGSGAVDLAGDVWKYRTYRKYKSSGKSSTKSSQQYGGSHSAPSSSRRGPAKQRRTVQARKGSENFSRRRRRAPYCRVHKKAHWCFYTRK